MYGSLFPLQNEKIKRVIACISLFKIFFNLTIRIVRIARYKLITMRKQIHLFNINIKKSQLPLIIFILWGKKL